MKKRKNWQLTPSLVASSLGEVGMAVHKHKPIGYPYTWPQHCAYLRNKTEVLIRQMDSTIQESERLVAEAKVVVSEYAERRAIFKTLRTSR